MLNAMPCVLPVLSLKLLSLAELCRRRAAAGAARAADDRARRARLVCADRGGADRGSKASGAAIGWGIQFQWPWFIAGDGGGDDAVRGEPVGLAADRCLPRFAYDAAAASRGRRPYADAFLTGAFATLLATPCSAPFVGTAVGFALAQGPAEIAAGVRRARARHGGALSRGRGGARGWSGCCRGPGAGWTGCASCSGWRWPAPRSGCCSCWRRCPGRGRRSRQRRRSRSCSCCWRCKSRRVVRPATARLARSAAAALVALAVLWPAFAGVAAPARGRRAPGAGGRSTPRAIRQLVGEGKTVFVDVTAAWCLTCKVNEAGGARPRRRSRRGCSGRMSWRCAATGPGPTRG